MKSHGAPERMDSIMTTTAFALLAALSLTACASTSETETDVAEESMTVDNSLTSNSLTSNSLTSNSLTSNSLTSNSLTSNSLTSNSLMSAALTDDPLARQLLKYIVGCALSANETIDITLGGIPYSFAGELGLAPAWGQPGHSCDANCRSWVSGCVLSRVNYLGETVDISLRGSLGALSASETELFVYPAREATYFGDIFASPQVRYACTSPGSSLISRVCGPSTSDCVMDVLGDCTAFCNKPRSDGSYPHCGPDDDTTFIGSVTVFRQ
jgi:hypothetical protein